jgi:tRNA modification GTPase
LRELLVIVCDDTIAAVASAPGPAARGVVRLSGPAALDCLAACFRPRRPDVDLRALATVQRLTGTLRIGRPYAEGLDVELPVAVLAWPTARSYTRQPAVEVHAPGSPPLLHAIVEQLCRCGARVARPGEFTLRAYLAGRLDLAQAEAVLGVIDARGEADLQAALDQLAGNMTRPLHEAREQLLATLAELEAGLDFVEEDIEFIRRDQVVLRLSRARDVIATAFAQLAARRQRAARPRVALVGAPNAGKSSLFNALVARYGDDEAAPRALVADLPGTTRDYVVASAVIDGLAVELIDTAGIDPALTQGAEHEDALQRFAQQAARDLSRQVDLQLLCLPAGERPAAAAASPSAEGVAVEVVRTKADVVDPRHAADAPAQWQSAVACSVRDDWGIDEIAALIRRKLAATPAEGSGAGGVALTASRCLASLEQAAEALDAALDLAQAAAGDELVAEQLRAALQDVGEVVGATCADDVLDRIFSQFCIGK